MRIRVRLYCVIYVQVLIGQCNENLHAFTQFLRDLMSDKVRIMYGGKMALASKSWEKEPRTLNRLIARTNSERPSLLNIPSGTHVERLGRVS